MGPHPPAIPATPTSSAAAATAAMGPAAAAAAAVQRMGQYRRRQSPAPLCKRKLLFFCGR